MNTRDYVELAKKNSKIQSDYALAQRLGVTRQTISKFQTGNFAMSDEIAFKIAQLAGKHPAIVLADIHAEREKDPVIRDIWLGMLDKLSASFNSLLQPAKIGVSA